MDQRWARCARAAEDSDVSHDLQRCPFCASRPKVFPTKAFLRDQRNGSNWTTIKCVKSSFGIAVVEVCGDNHAIKALNKWNTRRSSS